MTIDYARMQKVWPKQKAALTRARKTGDPERVKAVCLAAVKEWDEIGAWPDDWSHFERVLNDMLPWQQQTSLEELRTNDRLARAAEAAVEREAAIALTSYALGVAARPRLVMDGPVAGSAIFEDVEGEAVAVVSVSRSGDEENAWVVRVEVAEWSTVAQVVNR